MKNFIILLVSVFAMSSFNAFATNNEATTSTQSDSFYTCQFSLSHYSGKVIGGESTAYFKVLLNCPQEKDVYATVVAYVDGKRVASKVVKIKAGQTESDSTNISFSAYYFEKEYTLEVM